MPHGLFLSLPLPHLESPSISAQWQDYLAVSINLVPAREVDGGEKEFYDSMGYMDGSTRQI